MHRLTMASGHILEIGWHFGRQTYHVAVWHPDQYKDTDMWAAEAIFYGATPKEVLSKVRLHVSEDINPEIRAVRERIESQHGPKVLIDEWDNSNDEEWKKIVNGEFP